PVSLSVIVEDDLVARACAQQVIEHEAQRAAS
ncbi:MAG: hypothetical protein H6R46_1369, partial [Proteobacteria bacterium]|nr:hypothetical protein [Pseudomonadota bacterium]